MPRSDDDYGPATHEPCDWFAGARADICHPCYHWRCSDCDRLEGCACRDAGHDYYY